MFARRSSKSMTGMHGTCMPGTADDDSYQVRNESIRALEPGLTASWLHKAGACCKRGGRVLDVGSHFGYVSWVWLFDLGNGVGWRRLPFVVQFSRLQE